MMTERNHKHTGEPAKGAKATGTGSVEQEHWELWLENKKHKETGNLDYGKWEMRNKKPVNYV